MLMLTACRAVSSTSAQTTTSASATASKTNRAIFPGKHWQRWPSPEDAGYSSLRLAEAVGFLRETQASSALVIVGGQVLVDYGNTAEPSVLASVRKSVLDVLMGKYVANGQLRLDATLDQFGIDDVGGLSAEEKQATVADLLTTRSGVFHPACNPGDDLAQAPPRGSQPHGTYFIYSNWDFNVLGTIFEHATGRDVYEALETDLAKPLGMEDFRRDLQHKSHDDAVSIHAAYHMWLSTRDLARIGLLMLRGGEWNGQRLVPADWVQRSTHVVVPREAMHPDKMKANPFSYGYLWWIFDDDAARAGGPMHDGFTGLGAGGQFITVLPALDMVVAVKTKAPGDTRPSAYEQFLERLTQARCSGTCP
jgi:CubicO group peptidase (beta-lactamase class C family)